MSILLIGMNHRTAPVEVREQLAFSRDGVTTALLLFRKQFPQSEAAILSTCNRVEILVYSEGDTPGINDVISFIAQSRDLPVHLFKPYLYTLSGEQACRHFFRVASGLDSMVLGESQIVSQVKQAYAAASEAGTTGRVLNRLIHHTFEVSKRVRSETLIGEGKVSVPSVAIDVAKDVFDDFSSKQTLVVGAGEMAQLVCQYLRELNASKFIVTTRTLTNARALADACQGTAVPYAELDEQLVKADIIVTATSCPMPILTAKRIAEAQKQRRGRLLLIIDLAVPRNVEPEVRGIERVYLCDIDGLGKTVEENQKKRQAELSRCETILDEEVGAFERWLDATQLNPLVQQLFRDAQEVRDAELARLFRKCPDLSEHQRKEVAQLVERLANKFVHPCIGTLRRHSASRHVLADEWHATTQKLRAEARRERGE